jgi:DNA-directed RNA polymerase subunit RPC12/RpoP
MAVNTIIACPECKKKFKGRDDLEGKNIKCPSCGNRFIVKGIVPGKADSAAKPNPKAGPTAPPIAPVKSQKKAILDDEDEDPNPYGVTALDVAPRCPHCASPMADDEATICLNCGYNTLTRQMGTVTKLIAHTGSERFMWLFPGIVCLVVLFIFINLDIIFCLLLPGLVKGSWAAWVVDAEAARMWVVIVSLFIIWALGHFAFWRLVLNPIPPEKLKD